MTKIIIWGVGGRLGSILLNCINNRDNVQAVCGVDKFADPSKFSIPIFNKAEDINIDADVIIDFSRSEAIYDILPFAYERNLAVVLCTTGYSSQELDYINDYTDKLTLFKSSNMTLGVNLLINLAKRATAVLGETFDIEIIEQHHNIKVDSPSGTAITIAEAINDELNNSKNLIYGRHSNNQRRDKSEIGIHAVRGGTVVGKHDIMFLGNDEVITLSHEASSKAVFAEGAIKAAVFINGKDNGIYNMQDLLNDIL